MPGAFGLSHVGLAVGAEALPGMRHSRMSPGCVPSQFAAYFFKIPNLTIKARVALVPSAISLFSAPTFP